VSALELKAHELRQMRDADLAANTSLFVRLHNLEIKERDLECQVHRLLNAEHPPEADYTKHNPIESGIAKYVPKGFFTPDYAHIPTAEWESICAELEFLRSKRPDMDENGVYLSHDAYDVLERYAAIGRSVPWDDLIVWMINPDSAPDAERELAGNNVVRWIWANAPEMSAE
jgi:hypothetical protein